MSAPPPVVTPSPGSDLTRAALDALLDPSPGPLVATASAAEAAGCAPRWVRTVAERELAATLRDGGALVLLVHRLTMSIVRALHQDPVPLVILTGPADDTARDAILGLTRSGTMQLLGPQARLRYGDGRALICAPNEAELDRLGQALGGVRLALSPTPAWWWMLLDRPAAQDSPSTGYIPATILDEWWAHWAASQPSDRVLVPIGLPVPTIDEPAHPSLGATVAGHALERWTGPVFPSPRVMASVLRGMLGESPEPAPPQSDSGVWQQARRALPMTGAVVGMERARPSLTADVATAAFLAQRALLRIDAAHAAIELDLPRPHYDDEGLERSDEVLSSAGEVLTDHESKVVLRGFGIEVTRQAVASSASGAAGYADRIGFPVVLKALSPDLRRRQEIGAIALSLNTGAAVRRAYATIVDAVERYAPTARIDGVLVAEMVPPGLDLHCGAIRLPEGGVALFGGCMSPSMPVEPVLALYPLHREDAILLAHAILGRVPVPALRRANDPKIGDLASLLLRLNTLVEHHHARLELVELRPLRLIERIEQTARGYVTLDARIVQAPHLQGR